ncbi:ABC transporter permease [Candidatus Woesearchaeota archaeon]|nr:ABC transporter permease [Candidatus Woesearchaeota archaeon]
MNLEEIKYSLQNLTHRKMRSWLTVLSILIGIMAIYAIVSFGLGLQDYINTLSEDMGTDKIFIFSKSATGAPGTDKEFALTKDDFDFISKIKGIDVITPMSLNVAELEFKEDRRYNFILGLDPNEIDFINDGFTVDVYKGRNLREGDTNKIFLGYNYQFDLKPPTFEEAVDIGDKIEVNDEKFEVVGFYEEVGNPQDDSQTYITLDAFERLFPDQKDKYGYIFISAEPGEDPNELADKIKEKLRKYKGQEEGEETFYVQTLADLLETYNVVIGVLNGILVLIALISLIVASVNIMNTMYTAVLERTKEIGVMKAIGAKNSDILFVFIFESGFLGAVGGAIGVILGYLVAFTGGKIAAAYGYPTLYPIFPWYLTVGCILFAFFIGAIAGILPAIQASKQKPVDSLRYE